MSATVLTPLGNPIVTREGLEFYAERTLAHLKRPIRSHRQRPGTLWERASTEDKSQTNGNGWFIAYYIYDGPTRLPGAYDTHTEAFARIDLMQRLLGYHIVCGLRFTKSGKAYRFASTERSAA